MDKITIYHGSDHIIKKPEHGKGKIHNDYGPGFYCTEYIRNEIKADDPRLQ